MVCNGVTPNDDISCLIVKDHRVLKRLFSVPPFDVVRSGQGELRTIGANRAIC
jgi:hypothetical protein